MQYILTFSNSNNTNSFLGVFTHKDYCVKHMREHFKMLKKANAVEKHIEYAIHEAAASITTMLPYGDFQIWRLKGDRLRSKKDKAYVYFTFIDEDYDTSDMEENLNYLSKSCGGMVSGSGTDFKNRDYTVEIPLMNFTNFEAILKANKLKPKHISISSPYGNNEIK